MVFMEGPDRRREEDRIRMEGRLPPGQALTLKFPVLHYGPVPNFNPATWNFRIWGEVEKEKNGTGTHSINSRAPGSSWISIA